MNEKDIYYHDHGDGILHSHHAEEHTHDGASEHTHGHVHSHTQTKAVLNRLARAIGHLEHVRRMVEDGQDCTDVLIQLAAVRSALSSTAKIILKDHIEHCVTGANGGDADSLAALNDAINKFI
ncbi:MAG: metal-sensing transcriptional repressor [Oscillospiraceae bacterium]|nr:metal-sensing transcriptional repressor [Oscillospiraceae bacterium]